MDPETVSYRMARVGAAHRAAAAAALAPVGLHPGQEFLFALLWEDEGRSIGELAEALGVETPTVTKMVRRLTDAGLLERRADADDGRVTRVHCTAAGRALEAPTRQAWAQLERRTTSRLDPQDRRRLIDLLDQLLAGLDHD